METYPTREIAKDHLQGVLDETGVPRGRIRDRIAREAVERQQRNASPVFYVIVERAKLERIVRREMNRG